MKVNFNKIKVDRLSYERKLITATCVLVALVNIINTIINFVLDLGLALTLINFFIVIVFIVLIVLSRYDKYHEFVKWVVTLAGVVFIFLALFFNNGALGPTFFIILAYESFIIFLWHNRRMYFFLTLMAIAIISFFFIEYNYPNLIEGYSDVQTQIIDSYLGLFTTSLLVSFFSYTAKMNYLQQSEKAKQSDELKSLFLKNMSHEIRTPLNAIVGFSELVADESVNKSEQKQYAQIIDQNSKSLTALINNILDISNIESNQLVINNTVFNVVNLLIRLRDTFLPTLVVAGKENITIEIITDRFDIFLQSDEYRVEQVLKNIIENAVKYTHKGTIEVSLKPDDDKLYFYVKDTGIGIEEENLEIIFDRFIKLEDQTEALYRGTGVGLYLCKEIIRLLKGEIYVESIVRVGSTFSFYLPYTEEFNKY